MNTQLLYILLLSRYPTFSFSIISKAESGFDDVDIPDQLVALEFEHMLIVDPFSSSCGRFVNPSEAYGLSEQDALLIKEHNKVSLA
ncbi:MAG: hypothetical protein EXR88_03530 [Gammaproteobacteria bacterium]|nr:hypothetical protein [Gammaproteobacteria bacterium]